MTQSTGPKPGAQPSDSSPFVSIVMPCLNERDSIGECVDEAFAVLKGNAIAGEVVVSDNGSLDGSVEIALQHGARVVHQ
ncbi:MAG: glycosyltransferase, partial [Chloroflexota bacterium]